MLRSIRGNAKGIGAKIIVGLIAFSFIGFGALDFFSDGGVKDVMKINGQTIDEAQYAIELELLKNEVRSQMGENVDYSMLENDYLAEPAYERLTKRVLLEQALEAMDMVVPEALINANIMNTPDFQIDGQFSNELFKRTLSENGFDTNFYKSRLKDSIAERNINASIGLSNFSLPSERKALLDIINESREIEWVRISASDAKKGIKLSEGDVLDFFEANKASYQTRPSVELEYIQLELKDFYPDVSEEEIKSEFNRQLALFESEEQRAVSHILLEVNEELSRDDAQNKLKDIAAQFEGGESFSELAKSFSQDIGSASTGGSLGYVEKDGTFFPEFEDAVFALELNKISAPVETEAGWHLILVTDIQAEAPPVYDIEKANIKAQLQQASANKDYAIALEALKDISYNAFDLQEPAEEFNLPIQLTQKLERENIDPFFSDTRLMSAAFSDEVYLDGQNSEVIELSDNSSIVLRVKEKHEPRQQTLDEVRELIEAVVMKEQVAKVLEEKIAQIQSSTAGTAFTDKVAKAGYEVSGPISVSRNSTALNRELITEVFKSPRENAQNSAVSSFVSQTGDAYLFVVNSISRLSQAESIGEEVIKRTVENAYGQTDLAKYYEELELTAEIERF